MSNEYKDWLLDRGVAVASLLPQYRNLIYEINDCNIEMEYKLIIKDIDRQLKMVFNYYDMAIDLFYKRDWGNHLMPLLHSMEFLIADMFMKLKEITNSKNKEIVNKISIIINKTLEFYNEDELNSILEQDEEKD